MLIEEPCVSEDRKEDTTGNFKLFDVSIPICVASQSTCCDETFLAIKLCEADIPNCVAAAPESKINN